MRRLSLRRAPCPGRIVLALVASIAGLAPSVAHAEPVAKAEVSGAPPVDPNPARLVIDAPNGAEVRVDGILVGTLPLAEPIAADPGKHHVVVTANGNHPFVRDVVLERGKTLTLYADLESTAQRTVSWILISTGATAVAVGIGFGVASVVEHRVATNIDQGPDNFTEAEQAEYDRAIAARDDYRAASGVLGGAGLATFVTGAFLYAFDAPDVLGGSKDQGLHVDPIVSPGFAGAIATLRFR